MNTKGIKMIETDEDFCAVRAGGGLPRDLTIPRAVKAHRVTHIADFGFRKTKIQYVKIPYGVISIGNSAFADCKELMTVYLPASLAEIDSYAFFNCPSFFLYELPEAVTVIGSFAFSQTGITEIKLPLGLKEIKVGAFSRTRLEEIRIGSKVTRIQEHCFFDNRNLKNVFLPNSLTHIGEKAFSACPNIETVFFRGSKEELQTLLENSPGCGLEDKNIRWKV